VTRLAVRRRGSVGGSAERAGAARGHLRLTRKEVTRKEVTRKEVTRKEVTDGTITDDL
jgi:hypothetical protein